jgi:hypothetical protein
MFSLVANFDPGLDFLNIEERYNIARIWLRCLQKFAFTHLLKVLFTFEYCKFRRVAQSRPYRMWTRMRKRKTKTGKKHTKSI